MAYLDEMGLTYLWGKIKSALNKKLDAALGLTQEEADGRYLKLTGGTLREPLHLVQGASDGYVLFRDGAGNFAQISPYKVEATRVKVKTAPTEKDDAATKGYVDEAVATAISGAIEEAY